MGTMDRSISAVGSVAVGIIMMIAAMVAWQEMLMKGSGPRMGSLPEVASLEPDRSQDFGVRAISRRDGLRRALTAQMMSERCAAPAPVASPAYGLPAC